MTYRKELEVAYKAAAKAGEVMDQYSGRDLRKHSGTKSKEHVNDMATEADRKCQKKIIEIIENEFPGDNIIAEENDSNTSSDQREWIIDPIDGTSNFSTGLPYFSTSIAFRENREERVGIVYSPESALGRIWYAVEDEGAYRSDSLELDGEPIEVSEQESLEGAMIFSRLSERSSERREAEKPIVTDLLDRGIMLRRIASAAINLCMVADGSVDGYNLISINDWDVAAGSLILREAGGKCRIQESVFEDYIEIVASNGQIQQEYEKLVDSHIH